MDRLSDEIVDKHATGFRMELLIGMLLVSDGIVNKHAYGLRMELLIYIHAAGLRWYC